MGVCGASVWKWESDRAFPKISYIPAIIAFLGYIPFARPRSFPDRILAYRQLKGLSREALADELGVSEGSIWLWETEVRRPTSQSVLRVSAAIDPTLAAQAWSSG